MYVDVKDAMLQCLINELAECQTISELLSVALSVNTNRGLC